MQMENKTKFGHNIYEILGDKYVLYRDYVDIVYFLKHDLQYVELQYDQLKSKYQQLAAREQLRKYEEAQKEKELNEATQEQENVEEVEERNEENGTEQ